MKTRILASVLACVLVLHDLPKAQMEIVMAVLDSLRAGAEVSGDFQSRAKYKVCFGIP